MPLSVYRVPMASRRSFDSTIAALAAISAPDAAWPVRPMASPAVQERLAKARAGVATYDVRPTPAVPPVLDCAWDGVVRPASVRGTLLPWGDAAVLGCLAAHAGSSTHAPLARALAYAAEDAPEGLALECLMSPGQGAWPGCSLWMGEPLAAGTSGAVRLGFLQRGSGGAPGELVAVKQMRTRPDLYAIQWEPAAPAAGRAATGLGSDTLKPPPAISLPAPMVSPFARSALGDGTASSRPHSRRSSVSTAECHPERIVAEAQCQRTYSPHKLPVLALLQDETTGVHYLIMRWMRGGSLHQAPLDKRNHFCSAALGRLVLQSIAHDLSRLSPAGMTAKERALYPAGLAHDDIKPLNFFFDQDTVALGDWDVDTLCAVQKGHIPRTGTPRYMAPERFPFGTPSVASDMWSLGVSLVELFGSAECPFAYAELTRPQEGHTAHEQFAAFYRQLFAGDPQAKVERDDFARRLEALAPIYPVIVSWLRPMWKADPRLCVFVLRHLLNPAADQRLTPHQLLARRDEILPPRRADSMAKLRAYLAELQVAGNNPGNCLKVFLEQFLPQWAQVQQHTSG